MRTILAAVIAAALLAAASHCVRAAEPAVAKKPTGAVSSGPVDGVRFAVGWVQDEDAAKAGAGAYEQAIKELNTAPKAVVFFESFKDGAAAVKALREKAGEVPTIGTKAPVLVNGGVLTENTVAVLAIGGDKANVKIAKSQLNNDRGKTGTELAEALKTVGDLKIVMALSEPKLSFEDGVTVEAFLHGVLDTLGKDVSLWGGNGRGLQGLSGIEYYNDETLSDCVVALGLGGPVSVVYSTATEFQPVGEPVTVTKVSDVDPKLVLEFDGKPATDVYRERRGMPADEKFTRDAEHPIGVITRPDSVYVRQVLAAYPLDQEMGMTQANIEKDPLNGKIDAATKGLRFIAEVPVGTKAYVLKGGNSSQRIYDSANQCVTDMIKAIPAGKEPMLGLLSSCITRSSRIRRFTNGQGDEVFGGILPAMGDSPFPILGFYAWGEIGHINGEYKGLIYQYQQHSFVPVLLVQ